MNRIYWYLILAGVWILLSNSFTLSALLVGIGLSLLVFGLTEKLSSDPLGHSQLKGLLVITLIFLKSVIQANILLAWDILWRRKTFTHAFFKIDCSELTPWQTVLLGNMISLTPGSLTLDSDRQGRTLYVHTLYGDRVDTVRRQIMALVDRMSRLHRQASLQEGNP